MPTTAPEEPSGGPDPAALLAAMPEPIRQEAKVMLEDPNLIQRVVADIGLLGVAGEKELATTVYLAWTFQATAATASAYRPGAILFWQELCYQEGGLSLSARSDPGCNGTDSASTFLHAGEEPGPSVCRRRRAVQLGNDDTAEATRCCGKMLSEGRAGASGYPSR